MWAMMQKFRICAGAVNVWSAKLLMGISWRAGERTAVQGNDAGWAELARLVRYKQAWRGGEIATAERWYPDQHPRCAGETSPKDAGTDVHTAPAA